MASLDMWQSFRELEVTGFDVASTHNHRKFGDNGHCGTFSHSDLIRVQRSFFLDDDMFEVARDLDQNPMVQYPFESFAPKGQTSNVTHVINSSWNQLAAPYALLTSQRVYLCVSRIIFRPARPKDKAIISFMRGRIFNENWEHVHGYELKWQNSSIVFPRTFDVGTAFEVGGQLFGPEDPRIIVEHVADAQPVIVFNMVMPESGWRRAMFIHRPFTNHTTILTINGVNREQKEKNWTPLFLKTIDGSHNTHIHLVWKFAPLTALKCGLVDGLCDIVFQEIVSQGLLDQYAFKIASIRGGTQFVPIPCTDQGKGGCASQVEAFVSFPRHHVEFVGDLEMMKKPGYRPDMTILLTNGSHFYISYISGPLDFGTDTVMRASELNDPGGSGRIMIANSIASWDFDVLPTFGGRVPGMSALGPLPKNDVMTLLLSVDDDTVQVIRLAGVYQYIRNLPSMVGFFDCLDATLHGLGGTSLDNFSDDLSFEKVSMAAWSVRSCAEEAARTYTLRHSKTLKIPRAGDSAMII